MKKNGTIYNKKQKYQCNTCNCQFVENPKNKRITEKTKQLIDKLLLERLSLAGIARVTDVSERWLQNYVNDKFSNLKQEVQEIKRVPKVYGIHYLLCIGSVLFVIRIIGNPIWRYSPANGIKLLVKNREKQTILKG